MIAEKTAHPAPFPAELTRVPGILGDATDWIESSVQYPNRPLAFAAALSAVSLSLVGKVRAGDVGPALRVIAIGQSGSGKTLALHRAQDLLWQAGMGASLCGGFTSPEVVRDVRLSGTPTLWAEEHLDLIGCGRKRTQDMLRRAFDGDGVPVAFHGQCTPHGFREVFDQSETFRALVPGSVVVVADPRARGQESEIAHAVPDALVNTIRRWRDAAPRIIEPMVETCHIDQERDTLAARLALIYAASANPAAPAIGKDAADWAWRVIDAQPLPPA